VLVSADPDSDEGLAAATYISTVLQDMGVIDVTCLGLYAVEIKECCEHAGQARAIIVVMSEATLMCAVQISLLMHTMRVQQDAGEKGQQGPALIPVLTPSFRFPQSQQFFDDILGHLWSAKEVELCKILIKNVQHCTMVSLPVQGDVAVLHAHIGHIKSLIPEKRLPIETSVDARSSVISRQSATRQVAQDAEGQISVLLV
jgi:hypothetical protein